MPGPDLSSSRVGVMRLPLEEVWRRLEPELVQSSGFKNSLWAEDSFPLVSQQRLNGVREELILFITFWLP